MTRRLPIGVLVSGEGTTLDGLAELTLGEHLPVRIALVVADRPGTRALERARQRGLPSVVLSPRGLVREAWATRVTQELVDQGVELVVLAGFLSILPPSWVATWAGRAINVHPSLLPRFGGPGMYGERVHAAVLAAGERETGVTVHLVSSDVDAGPTIAQERVPIDPGATAASVRDRLRPVEIQLLAATLRRFAEGALPLPYAAPPPAAPAERDRRDARA